MLALVNSLVFVLTSLDDQLRINLSDLIKTDELEAVHELKMRIAMLQRESEKDEN